MCVIGSESTATLSTSGSGAGAGSTGAVGGGVGTVHTSGRGARADDSKRSAFQPGGALAGFAGDSAARGSFATAARGGSEGRGRGLSLTFVAMVEESRCAWG
ncbi:hypothetical protein MVI01_19340 [Myxococcus virescens]|uniref:Uncharacterized protein n=1 Tax=Myxococcus virescens TaxID=83456 RepID=A0A511H9F9_9BACT|nr:hypothetical protein MVI01_19340 [Myxococcus virescens]